MLTAPQEPLTERLRRALDRIDTPGCLNHFIILNARHRKRTLAAYFRYYHQSGLTLHSKSNAQFERQIIKHGAIAEIPEPGGLQSLRTYRSVKLRLDALMAHDRML